MPALLDLPSEIRRLIWRECVASSRNRYNLTDGYAKYKLHLNVLRVNRTVYHEVRDVFRRENVFCRIITPWPSSEEYIAVHGRVPLITSGRQAVPFTDVHLLVNLDFPGSPHPNATSSYCIICIDDLSAFCDLWQYVELTHDAMNRHFGLRLHLRDPNSNLASSEDRELSPALQRRLLLPFVKVKRLASVNISGKVDPNIRAELLGGIKDPYESPERCLARTEAFIEDGTRALNDRRPVDAIRSFEDAFRAMFIIVYGRARDEWAEAHFDCSIVGGPHDGEPGNLVRLLYRIELTGKMIAAFNMLRDYTMAHYWGNRSITLARTHFGDSAEIPQAGFPNADGWGRVWLRTAIASRRLDKLKEASEQISIAYMWLEPGDAEFMEVWPEFVAANIPGPGVPGKHADYDSNENPML